MLRASVFYSLLLLLCTQPRDVYLCMEELLQRVDASEYGYTPFNGPASWSNRFDACKGISQSPVKISMCEKVKMPQLVFHGHADYRPDGFRLHNTFQSVEIQYSGDFPMLWGGPLKGNYSLLQIHFHWDEENTVGGSEHVIKGYKHVLEAHMVHMNSKYNSPKLAAENKDGLVVVSLLFKGNKFDNIGLSELTTRLQSVQSGDAYTLMSGSAMTWLQDALEDAYYFTYVGSLTTPPCTQSVTWVVLKTTNYIGYEQLQSFRSLRGHESFLRTTRRPLQPINNRTIICSIA